MRQPGIEPGAKQWECLSLPLTHWRWSMGVLLNVSIFMEPLSNCTCCEARQIPIYQSTPFLKYIQMRYSPIKHLSGAFKNRLSKFQMAFTTESAPTEISFFAQIRNMLIFPKGRGVVAQCERRRPSKKDGRDLRIQTWNQTEPPGEPRHRGSPRVHEGNGVWQKRAFSRAVDKF